MVHKGFCVPLRFPGSVKLQVPDNDGSVVGVAKAITGLLRVVKQLAVLILVQQEGVSHMIEIHVAISIRGQALGSGQHVLQVNFCPGVRYPVKVEPAAEGVACADRRCRLL